MKTLITYITLAVALCGFSPAQEPVVETREIVPAGSYLHIFPSTLDLYVPLKFRADTAWELTDEQAMEIATYYHKEGWDKNTLMRILKPYDRTRWSYVHALIWAYTES